MNNKLIDKHRILKEILDKLDIIIAQSIYVIDNNKDIKKIHELVNELRKEIIRNKNRIVNKLSNKEIIIKDINDLIKYGII